MVVLWDGVAYTIFKELDNHSSFTGTWAQEDGPKEQTDCGKSDFKSFSLSIRIGPGLQGEPSRPWKYPKFLGGPLSPWTYVQRLVKL